MTRQFDLSIEQVRLFNLHSAFLARRDVEELSVERLHKKYQINRAKLLILLGSSLPYSAEVAAQAYKEGIAKEIMIVGGIGHSTEYLKMTVKTHSKYHKISVHNKPEAEIFKEILVSYEGIPEEAILLENTSTNCGANAAEALKLLKRLNKHPDSIILIQDPTMQLRTDASFRKEWGEETDTIFINYAPFIPALKYKNGALTIDPEKVEGLWDIERYVSLLLGEIPRLQDNENGYGPKGKGFIIHVDVPTEIEEAYRKLFSDLEELSRPRTNTQ